MSNKSLALFDFDGTITTKDSFIQFIKYYHGSAKLILGIALHLPILVLFKFRIIPNWKAKEALLKYFFKGHNENKFNKKAAEFAINRIPGMLNSETMALLSKHLSQNDDVYVVSASFENWLSPWFTNHNVQVIASRLETKDNTLTGNIYGANCYGPEKVSRIKEKVDLKLYSKIYAYGDSRGDKEMLEIADYGIRCTKARNFLG
ncbi:MAG: HAD-IB family hydrolase [Bacteroidota bacterium]